MMDYWLLHKAQWVHMQHFGLFLFEKLAKIPLASTGGQQGRLINKDSIAFFLKKTYFLLQFILMEINT